MVAWLLIIIMFPLIGSSIYAMLGESRVAARAERRRKRRLGIDDKFVRWFREHVDQHENLSMIDVDDSLHGIAITGKKLANTPVTGGNKVEIIDDPEAFHHRVVAAVRAAEDNLNMLFYIWNPDESGQEVMDAVIERAKAGVTCRILLDSAGSVHVPRDFMRPAEEAGVMISFFMPLRPTTRRYSVHLRNHRKIVVVDGKFALVGSQNVGNEERGCGTIQPYQQVSLAVEGPAVCHLQAVFAGDWRAYGDDEDLCNESCFPQTDNLGDVALQIVPTGPDQPYHVVERMLMEALGAAKKSVWIATPYFVPSTPVRLALGQASVRGVSVNILVPGQTDRAPALWAGRSFYGELLTENVKIFEYGDGMVHSKLIAIDDAWCMVGTANMDFRSFRLNFEVSALGYDTAMATRVGEIIQGYIEDATQVTVDDVSNRSFGQQLLAGSARLLASQL